uniref:Ricin B lectin domain-containing protein n=1 Tax=Poecilia formosa TaxID=48698 RepID=A0A087XEU1_POEFO
SPGSCVLFESAIMGKCLQVQEGATGGQASLGECSPDSPVQEWRWLPKVQALSSLHTGECLTAPRQEYEGVVLRPCVFKDGAGGEDVEREARGQAWTCTKKGHITLLENRLHLSATKHSTLVFLQREHKQQGSKWRALDNQTLCNISPLIQCGRSRALMKTELQAQFWIYVNKGMGWKITMLVLSSLALVLGTIILILNVYSNRRRKVVCALKSHTPTPEVSIPGSPAPNERAALTEHAMHFPHSSPSSPRGEILIEWKDGTVTPLYE